MPHKVLLIDDDNALARLVSRELGAEGWTVRQAHTALRGVELAREEVPDIVLLDLGLPDLDGFEVCRRLRADPTTARVPIIFVTARGDEIDRVVGLEIGGDDYLSKPFSVRELKARVRAVLRRTGAEPRPSLLSAGQVVVDPTQRRLRVCGQDVEVRMREFDLLVCLLREPGRVWRRDELLTSVWGFAHASDLVTRTVDVHVRRLRQKLGQEGRRLETVKGVGYRFTPQP